MRPKVLESYLQNLDSFEKPKIGLEQYATPPHIAANMLHIMGENFDDIEGKFVCDLGCGCGMLTFGAALSDAGSCIGFEIDSSALEIAQQNKENGEFENVDFLQCDVLELNDSRWAKVFDTVIMNPPFGTKNSKGIDLRFLKTALSLAKHAVYSLHKTCTVEHIKKICRGWNVNAESLYGVKYNISSTYKRHQHSSIDVDVTLLRFTFKKES